VFQGTGFDYTGEGRERASVATEQTKKE